MVKRKTSNQKQTMAKKNNAAPPAPTDKSFGITIAAALALTNDQAADEFAERANVRKLCFRDQGKLIYSMTTRGLAPGETVYSILRAKGVHENSIQNAKRAADVIADLVGAELVTEAELDAVITHAFCVNYKRCTAAKIPTDTLAAIIKAPNAGAEMECLAMNGKTLSEMETEAAAKADAAKAAEAAAAAEKQSAAEKAAADAAAAQAAAEKAAVDKAAAEKLAAENAAKEKELAAKSADADAKTSAAAKAAEQAAKDAAAAKEAAANAAEEKAAAEKLAAENAAKEKELAAKNAETEKRLQELKAAEEKAAAAAAAAPPPAPAPTKVEQANQQAAKDLMSSRAGKLPSPEEILQNLTAALTAVFSLPNEMLATVPDMLDAAKDEINQHLKTEKSKAIKAAKAA